jgi:predicted ArsR family transcriptional regulator
MAFDRLEDLPEPRRKLLVHLKLRGGATISELASDLGTSGEAVRQQLAPLETEGSVFREGETVAQVGAGRPAVRFRLTKEGERLFPKSYDDLAVMVVDAVREELGDEALVRILTRLTDQRVANLAPRMRKLPLREKMDQLRAIYDAEDPFIEVREAEGGYELIERNCPFLSVATLRPLLCSCTVSVLTRLLERPVVREKRFQDGQGCCSFRVYADHPIDVSRLRFALEPQATAVPPQQV